MNKMRLGVLLLLCLGAGLLFTRPAPVAAHANLTRSEPAAGSTNLTAPTTIRLVFSETPELKYSEITVYDATGKEYQQGALQPLNGEPLGFAIGVRTLPEGIYTVRWRASSTVDGHSTVGSFAFSVGDQPPPAINSAATLTDNAFIPATSAETITKWLAILTAAALVGALGLRLLVWLPLSRRTEVAAAVRGGVLDRQIARRLLLLAGGALFILFLVTIVGLLLQVSKVTGRSFLGALDGGALSGFLFNTRTGAIWLARLLLPLVAAMLLAPAFDAALRHDAGAEDPERAAALSTPLPVAFGFVCGLAYLLSISLISHAAATPFWVPLAVGLDWLHLVGTAIWIGGLIGLVVTTPLFREEGAATRPLLAGMIGGFSKFAVGSAVLLTLTGTYSAWLHVGTLDALTQTDYGRLLIAKLALFAGLLAFGAFNQRWLLPRLLLPGIRVDEREMSLGDMERTVPRLVRLFGRTIRIEVLLAVALLLLVATMTGSVPAREALAQAHRPQRAQTVVVDGVRVTVTLAALQPGNNNFDIFLRTATGDRPITDAEQVALRFTERGMDMGEAEAITTARGDGHYTTSGQYLAMSGEWEIRALIRRAGVPDIDHTFAFQIGSTTLTTANSGLLTAPQIPRWNSIRGFGFIALALALFCIVAGVRLFRRGSGFGTALLMLVPTLLVVGGYLLYNGERDDVNVTRVVEPSNPIRADAASIARGQTLFAQNCVVCHGTSGRGDAPGAASLNPRPPDFSLPHTAYHSDGSLYNTIHHGSPGSAMPAWGSKLTESQQWDLVNAIRQFNRLTAAGATPAPPRIVFPLTGTPTRTATAAP